MWTVAEPGARLTYGAVTLSNPSNAPLTVERVELVGRTDGFRLLDMKLAPLVGRPPHPFEPRYPPALPREPRPVGGYVIPPKPQDGYQAQLLVGMEVLRNRPPVGWHALRIEYRVGDDRYVAIQPFSTSILHRPDDALALEPWVTETGPAE